VRRSTTFSTTAFGSAGATLFTQVSQYHVVLELDPRFS